MFTCATSYTMNLKWVKEKFQHQRESEFCNIWLYTSYTKYMHNGRWLIKFYLEFVSSTRNLYSCQTFSYWCSIPQGNTSKLYRIDFPCPLPMSSSVSRHLQCISKPNTHCYKTRLMLSHELSIQIRMHVYVKYIWQKDTHCTKDWYGRMSNWILFPWEWQRHLVLYRSP